MDMMTSLQAAEKWGISKRQVNFLCSHGRIPKAKLENNRWMIPADFDYISNKKQNNNTIVNQVQFGKFINIGNEGFRSIRNGEYVDKTELIQFVNSCINTSQKLICVSRPRRFGKSFATKMLCAYYSKCCNSIDLFRDLKIAKDSQFYYHLNKYDVIYLDITLFLSTIKQDDHLVENVERSIVEDIANIYPNVSIENRLIDALIKMNEVTGSKIILIIDEWDAMFRECKGKDYILNQYILLLRSMFKSSLTDKLFAMVYMTGILPIKKYGHESAVSDFYEYSMVEPRPLQEFIGFTLDEVRSLCQKYNMSFELMQQWYDGYHVAGVDIYNPKSVMESILRKKYSNYWTKTETYEALRDYLDMNFDGLKDAVIDMLGGQKFEVDTGSFQNDMTSMKCKDDVLTLLIHLGYLAYDEDDKKVSIPNDEIKEEFIRALKNSNRHELMKAVKKSDELLKATWNMDEEKVADIIDFIHNEEIAPAFYNNEQALRSVVKIAYLSSIDYYSRIEEMPSGKGYADIIFFPRRGVNKPALIIELKWNKSDEAAIYQIKERKYDSILREYEGNVILVGINYDTTTKKHTCIIEKNCSGS